MSKAKQREQTVGARLRARRESLGHTQREFAALAETDQSTLSDIERDVRGVGRVLGGRLAKACKWTMDELFNANTERARR